MQNGSEELINSHFDLLNEIAGIRIRILKKAGIHHIQSDELINEGYVGLRAAAEKYNADLGKDFSDFARYYINNSISKFLRNEDIIDFRQRKKIKDMIAAEKKLMQLMGREPTDQEMAGELKIDTKELNAIRSKNIFLVSIEDTEKTDTSRMDFENDSGTQEHQIVNESLAKATDDCMKKVLKKDELFIVLLNQLRNFSANDIEEMLDYKYNIQKIYRIIRQAGSKLKKCIELKGWQITDLEPF